MEIKITIPDDKIGEVIEAFAREYKYQATIGNPDYDHEDPKSPETIPNPESKARFAKRQVVKFIKNVYISQKVKSLQAEKEALIKSSQEEIDTITVT